ncbi:MAG TPA: glycoside hydrolase family 99-like domain-containing protein [Tepidisphaeraceae bacterium]|jgi:hypothetical protein|nr:glycoside hydrolase family 99-like domain-containing protein [Tepidisphaeraceae bacterium]
MLTKNNLAGAERPNPRLIAFYLPQYYPIPENDTWWGKGFTEWTNVVKAGPVFAGHYQPHLPADLGFYDLRLAEARAAQCELAREHGIHGFCYYHYWFSGRRLLERPVNEMLASREPDFPFCLCWANESWTRRWDGRNQEILLEQRYAAEDDVAHIRSLIPAFEDARYIRVDGKPLFLVYHSTEMPDSRATTYRWRREAERAGLPGLYLVRVESFEEQLEPQERGFDAGLEFQPFGGAMAAARLHRFKWWQRQKLRTRSAVFNEHSVYSYAELVNAACQLPEPAYPWIRSVCPSWDNTARRKKGGVIFHGSTPDLFEKWVAAIVGRISRQENNPGGSKPILFVNAWNEWAEGNHLEPCQRWGRDYLEAIKRAIS